MLLPDNYSQVAPRFPVNLDLLQHVCPPNSSLVDGFLNLVRISVLFSLEPLEYQLFRFGVEMEIADAGCDIKSSAVFEDFISMDLESLHGLRVAQVSVWSFFGGASDEIASVGKLGSHLYFAWWEHRNFIGHVVGRVS
jgi:hypothetical protein